MMTLEHFNSYCATLTAASHVVQWSGTHVWKVGNKLFAMASYKGGKHDGITFKVSAMAFDLLQDQPGCRPAPYLASRGMKWIQVYDTPGLRIKELKAYIKASHALVASGLSKKKQKELGLLFEKE